MIEILRDPEEIGKLAYKLLKLARDEILIMFSLPSSFLQAQKEGAMDLVRGAALQHNSRVKILATVNEQINDWQKKIGPAEKIEIRNIEPVLHLNITILTVDRKYSLVVEEKTME